MKKHVSILLGLLVIFSSLFTSCNNEDELDPNICKITVKSEGNGKVAISDYIATSVNVLIGNRVEVVATPDDGWEFIGWYVSGTETPISTDTAFTFITSEGVTLTARFAQLLEIIICSEGYGDVSFEGTTGYSIMALYGTEVTVVATPDDKAEFLGWFIEGSETAVCLEENYSLIVKENITLIGKFSKLNSECNIIAVKASWLELYNDILTRKPTISQNKVIFYVNETTSIESIKLLEPEFELSSGAQIEKLGYIENNDRSVYFYYRTVSEDDKWSKDYTVKFIKQTFIPTDMAFSFENYSLDSSGKYYTWFEEINNTMLDWWSSGNAGFKIMVASSKKPHEYPTTIHEEGYTGNCVKLTTCDTGVLGKGSKMPIAAGSIFIGEFDSGNAMKAPLEATRMGMRILPPNAKPLSLTGYYKYTPGEKFTDKEKKVVEGRRDACAIYAVVFEVDPEDFESLNGVNVTSSDRIVLIAELQNPGEPTEWTEFYVPFEPRNGKVFEYDKLESNEYAITVVASSSKDGAYFNGAVGSTLLIDELKINWEK